MSQTALTDFARIAQQLAEALDKHRPTQGNQTLVVLSELANQLPDDNPLRLSIEQQMAKIAATEFTLDNQDLNKTLIILGTLKGRLSPTDVSQEKIDILMAKVLAAKFDIVNGQQDPSQAAGFQPVVDQPESAPQAEPAPEPATEPAEEPQSAVEETPEAPAISIPETTEPSVDTPAIDTPAVDAPEAEAAPQPEAESAPAVDPAAQPTNQPEPQAEPEPAPENQATEQTTSEATADSPITAFADQIHSLQIALDQLPAATRQAFEELKAIEDKGGTVQDFAESIAAQANGNDQVASERIKTELERLSVLVNKIEDAPAEADQFQVLYDQVDDKHKDLKSGVFSIFQREYGGNARRFVVERTAQYAKYVPAEESRQRMIEDLHKLIEQAQKSLGQAPAKGAADKPKPPTRAFFHG